MSKANVVIIYLQGEISLGLGLGVRRESLLSISSLNFMLARDGVDTVPVFCFGLMNSA